MVNLFLCIQSIDIYIYILSNWQLASTSPSRRPCLFVTPLLLQIIYQQIRYGTRLSGAFYVLVPQGFAHSFVVDPALFLHWPRPAAAFAPVVRHVGPLTIVAAGVLFWIRLYFTVLATRNIQTKYIHCDFITWSALRYFFVVEFQSFTTRCFICIVSF